MLQRMVQERKDLLNPKVDIRQNGTTVPESNNKPVVPTKDSQTPYPNLANRPELSLPKPRTQVHFEPREPTTQLGPTGKHVKDLIPPKPAPRRSHEQGERRELLKEDLLLIELPPQSSLKSLQKKIKCKASDQD